MTEKQTPQTFTLLECMTLDWTIVMYYLSEDILADNVQFESELAGHRGVGHNLSKQWIQNKMGKSFECLMFRRSRWI